MGEDTHSRWSWHRILWLAPVAFGLLFLLIMVALAGGFEPFLFVIAVITLVTGYVGRRFPRRAGPITVLVVMALLIVANLPSILDDLAHPDSFWNFAIFGVVAVTLALLGIIASIAILTSRGTRMAPRIVYTALAVIVGGVLFSGITTLGLEDDVAVAGDLIVVAEEVEFSPTSLTTSGDTVGIFVENKDPVRHTFTIEALDIEIDLPGSTDRRVEISAAPGTYEFACKVPGHDNMTGTLTIGS